MVIHISISVISTKQWLIAMLKNRHMTKVLYQNLHSVILQ